MKCKYCNAELDREAMFCTNCGKDLSKFDRCEKCGELLGKDALFCTVCGTKKTIVPNVAADDNKKEKNSKMILWIIIGVLVFLLLFGAGGFAYYAWSQAGKASTTEDEPKEFVEDTSAEKDDQTKDDELMEDGDQSEEESLEDNTIPTSGSQSGLDGVYTLSGSIDRYPITMEIVIDGTHVSGNYYYKSKGPNNRLLLSGTNNDGYLDINETDENGTPTGHFRGTFNNGVYQGQFTTSQGNSMSFRIESGSTANRQGQTTEEMMISRARQVGSSGDLKVTLLWDFYADIDLHILQPNGREIWYRNKSDASTGGMLDVDHRNGGLGAAENIYWQNPPSGQYKVAVKYYGQSKNTGKMEPGTCSVIVFLPNEQPKIYKMNLSQKGEIANICTFSL